MMMMDERVSTEKEKEQQELGKMNRGGEQAGLWKKKECVEEANKSMAGGGGGRERRRNIEGANWLGWQARLAEKQSKEEKKKRREKKKNSSLKTQER